MLWEIWMALAVLVGSLLVVTSLPRRRVRAVERDPDDGMVRPQTRAPDSKR
jgi:hypothetical protein